MENKHEHDHEHAHEHVNGSVLCDAEILKELNESVLIEPFHKHHLSNSSYDVTLGSSYYLMNSKFPFPYFCGWKPEHVKAFWNEKPSVATIVETKSQAEEFGVEIGDQVIIVPPGQTILAHTNEFIGGVKNITTMMKARSSMGRICITVCKCAGWGDIGYVNRWTMEIENTASVPAVLLVGEPVAQIIFFRTGNVTDSYETKGSYQTGSSTDFKSLRENWKPQDMLPRLKRKQIKN